MFGRRRRAQVTAQPPDPAEHPSLPQHGVPITRAASGPYDIDTEPDVDAHPDNGWARLDLGSLRLPVPEGAQLQVEVDRSGPVRAVHLMTGLGQITLTAFAAPRSGGLWREVVPELLTKLRADGARVGQAAGEWGEEVEAVTDQGVLVFLGVDGPRWMLRGVAAGPSEGTQARIQLLREVVRHTVVVRGAQPLPVGSPLPLQLSDALAEQLRQATAELVDATAGEGADA